MTVFFYCLFIKMFLRLNKNVLINQLKMFFISNKNVFELEKKPETLYSKSRNKIKTTHVDLMKPNKVYLEKKEAVRKAILASGKESGEFFMTLPQMSEKFKTSLNTMSKVVSALQDEGLLLSQKGKGISINRLTPTGNRCIGWFITQRLQPSHFYRQEFERGFEDAAGQCGYNTAIWTLLQHEVEQEPLPFLEMLASRHIISGVIIESFLVKNLNFLIKYNIPYVCVGGFKDESIWAVDVTPLEIFNYIMEFLTGCCHRRIGIVDNINPCAAKSSGKLNEYEKLLISGSEKTRIVYEDYVDKGLIDGSPELFFPINILEEGALGKIIRWYKELSVKPSAIFMPDATMAWKMVQALRNEGIRVPEDVSIVSKGSSLVPEELSMWEMPVERTAAACIRLLKRQIEGDISGNRQEKLHGNLRFGKTVKLYKGDFSQS